jgi:hypothetical protein
MHKQCKLSEGKCTGRSGSARRPGGIVINWDTLVRFDEIINTIKGTVETLLVMRLM